MKLGINQIALLRRCHLKGYIGIYDVSLYYPLKDGRKRIAILEKLSLRGLLETKNNRKWFLTDRGIETLKENLRGSVNV